MKSYFESLKLLSQFELDQLDQFIKNEPIPKNTFILNSESVCTELIFVKSGVLRSFFINYDGEEATLCLAFDGEFMADYSSLISQQPSKETIHSLVESDIDRINYHDLEFLFNSSISWQKVGRRLIELQYLAMEKHFTQFQQNKGLERYSYLLQHYATQLNLIPQSYIASYLGISSRQLSRIRKSLL